MELGRRIRDRRKDLGWTQGQLAERAAISKGFLSDLENGKRSVGADILLDIARALSSSLDYLMVGEPSADTGPAEVEIPGKLVTFASEAGLGFSQTLALLQMHRQIIAHRSGDRSKSPDDVDWRRFYESVREFL